MSELLTCTKHDSEFVKVAVIYHVNVPRLQPCPVCLEITGLQARVLESGQRITDLQINFNLALSRFEDLSCKWKQDMRGASAHDLIKMGLDHENELSALIALVKKERGLL